MAGIYAAKMQQPGPDDEHRLSIRVTTDLKERFEKVCLEKKISQQAAIVALMAWFVEQPELLQTLVLGHIKGKHEVRAVAEQALRIYVDGNAILATNFDQVLDERDKKRAAKQRAKPPARRD